MGKDLLADLLLFAIALSLLRARSQVQSEIARSRGRTSAIPEWVTFIR
jgi:hypothetical protein